MGLDYEEAQLQQDPKRDLKVKALGWIQNELTQGQGSAGTGEAQAPLQHGPAAFWEPLRGAGAGVPVQLYLEHIWTLPVCHRHNNSWEP